MFKFSNETVKTSGFLSLGLPPGVNMGICLLLTGLISAAAILGCMLLLICVKMAAARDKRKSAEGKPSKGSVCKKAAGSVEEGVNPASALPTTNIIAPADAHERVGLTTVSEENDI